MGRRDEESREESMLLEESPCCRWRKMRAEVGIPRKDLVYQRLGRRDEESKEESMLLEESPCGRRRKMRIPRNGLSLTKVVV